MERTAADSPGRAQSADSIDYTYRETEPANRPLALLKHFLGNLDKWDLALVDRPPSPFPFVGFAGGYPRTVATDAIRHGRAFRSLTFAAVHRRSTPDLDQLIDLGLVRKSPQQVRKQSVRAISNQHHPSVL
jgi:hypothetical protein